MTKALMAGIDLHSNNLMIGIVDQDGQRVRHQKLACELQAVAEFLRPYKRRLQSLAVESTYNWYWLVDGLQALGYPVVLANPAKIDQYSGIKHADDKNDAYFLAELQRLNMNTATNSEARATYSFLTLKRVGFPSRHKMVFPS